MDGSFIVLLLWVVNSIADGFCFWKTRSMLSVPNLESVELHFHFQAEAWRLHQCILEMKLGSNSKWTWDNLQNVYQLEWNFQNQLYQNLIGTQGLWTDSTMLSKRDAGVEWGTRTDVTEQLVWGDFHNHFQFQTTFPSTFPKTCALLVFVEREVSTIQGMDSRKALRLRSTWGSRKSRTSVEPVSRWIWLTLRISVRKWLLNHFS